MALRVPSWRTCTGVAWLGLALVFLADAVLGGARGWELFVGTMKRAGALVSSTWRTLRLDTTHDPDIEVWLALATIAAVLGWLAARGRATDRAGLVLRTATFVVGIALVFMTWGTFGDFLRPNVPGLLGWSWLAMLTLLCGTAWMRRHEELAATQAWERRASPPYGDMPSLDHLSDGLAELVRETRAVRASFDVGFGLDRDARRLLWEWCYRIDACTQTDCLATLGLASTPVRAVINRDRATGVAALLEVDAALARIETALLGHRSYAFR